MLLVISTWLQVLSQIVNPGRGDRGCLAGKMQQTICTAVDLFIGNSVTCHIQLGSGGYSNVGGSASLHSKTLSGG